MRERALRRKEAQKRLEEENLENMDQFIFRGMRDRGIVREDVNIIIPDEIKFQWYFFPCIMLILVGNCIERSFEIETLADREKCE